MANYEAYTKKYKDLLANYQQHWAGKISLTQYGQMHYNAYGKNEGRNMPGASSAPAAKAAPTIPQGEDGQTYPIRKSSQVFGSNPNKGYSQRATVDSGSKGGNSVTRSAPGGANVYMTKRGQRAINYGSTLYYERDPGSGKFQSTVGGDSGGWINISDYKSNPEPAPAPAPKPPSTSVGVRYAGPPKYAPVGGGPTSSASVNTGVSNVTAAVNTGTAAITAAANPDYPDAPSWVKNQADFIKWKKSQSATTGFISTINTSSTGLTEDEYDDNVKVTALTG